MLSLSGFACMCVHCHTLVLLLHYCYSSTVLTLFLSIRVSLFIFFNTHFLDPPHFIHIYSPIYKWLTWPCKIELLLLMTSWIQPGRYELKRTWSKKNLHRVAMIYSIINFLVTLLIEGLKNSFDGWTKKVRKIFYKLKY